MRHPYVLAAEQAIQFAQLNATAFLLEIDGHIIPGVVAVSTKYEGALFDSFNTTIWRFDELTPEEFTSLILAGLTTLPPFKEFPIE